MPPGDDVIEQEIRYAAPPEAVFPFFTDPDKMRRWQGIDHKVDAQPGGIYRIDMDGTHVVRGQFVEVSPPHRVIFTWGWEDGGIPVPAGSTTVEITLTADGDDTIVRLVHRGLPLEAVESHVAGWRHYLARLAVAGAGGDPGPDPGPSSKFENRNSKTEIRNQKPNTNKKGRPTMAKFVFLYTGGQMADTPEAQKAAMDAWMGWFGTLGDDIVDPGNPFGASSTVKSDGSSKDGAAGGMGGYSVISANSLADAAGKAKGCPVLAGGGTVEVYEAIPI